MSVCVNTAIKISPRLKAISEILERKNAPTYRMKQFLSEVYKQDKLSLIHI